MLEIWFLVREGLFSWLLNGHVVAMSLTRFFFFLCTGREREGGRGRRKRRRKRESMKDREGEKEGDGEISSFSSYSCEHTHPI